jgi:hypothetical protein
MTKLRIEIDTASIDTESKSLVATANKVGLLSTIPLSSSSGSSLPIADAFWSAVGQTKEEKGDQGYKAAGLLNGKNDLKSKNCKAIAIAGGLPAFTAINGANDIPFVSLVGCIPIAVNSQCSGGVSLESYKSSLRRQYLVNLGQNPANIYLLTNNNSPNFHQAESADWNSPGTLIVSYVGDGNGNNDASKIPWDWIGDGGSNPAKIPNTATAVVISDDPFFQANRPALVQQANNWLAGSGNRRVVYPSTIYSSTVPAPASGQSIFMGCDLVGAYRLLGALAASVSLNPNVNFGFIRLAPEPAQIQP